MKKLLIAMLATGLVSTSVMAAWVGGTVDSIRTNTDGSSYIVMKRTGDNKKIGMKISNAATADGKKMLLTVALTAQTTGKSVIGWLNGSGWTSFQIKK
ncbi:MAG: hypothetical protein DSZ03_06385 [Sulfurimonas sp.]|nr:MAG: hypothetical protein DSZ03_06385 [Sulfurimonas sp.]